MIKMTTYWRKSLDNKKFKNWKKKKGKYEFELVFDAETGWNMNETEVYLERHILKPKYDKFTNDITLWRKDFKNSSEGLAYAKSWMAKH